MRINPLAVIWVVLGVTLMVVESIADHGFGGFWIGLVMVMAVIGVSTFILWR